MRSIALKEASTGPSPQAASSNFLSWYNNLTVAVGKVLLPVFI